MSLTDDAWRSALHTAYDVFAPLFKQDITLSLPYGILSGAILWSVRDAEEAPIQRAWLETACDPEHLSLLLKSVRGWDILDPLGAARAINKRATDNPALRAALDTVLAYCREDMLTYSMIKQITDSAASISVGGDVSGGNVNIGGYQYIVGDLIIQYITPKAERMCPTPPAPPLYFGGRDAILSALKDKIKAGENIALTAINGVGGVGKTTLARALAHQMHTEKVFRAVLWADVTRAPDALSILRGWALSYADSSFSTENMKPDQIAAAVKGLLDDVINKRCEICEPSRVLVVLDDVWDSGLEAARLIQTACPDNATLLITTRSENLAHNMQARVEPLGYLSPEDAAALLAKYLPETDAAPLRELGKALGGHALALELAARRIKKEAGRDTLDNALRRCLTDYQRGIPAGSTLGVLKLEQGEKREDNLTVALALSYQDLSDADQRRFRALGVLAFDAPFDQTILAALWDTPPERVDDLADTLRLLSLIQADIGGYRQHPLLRSYALALLKQADELENTFARYADQVILIAEKFYELPLEQWVQLTPYLPHIYAAGNELVVRTSNVAAVPEIVLKRAQLFALNTSYYLANRREVRQIDWTEMGLAVSRQLEDAPREARFLNDLGVGYSALGDNARALDYYAQALPLRRAVGDRRGEAATLTNIGLVYSALGDNARALDYYAQALPLRRAVGDRRGEASTLSNIGAVYSDLGDNARALDYFEQALPLRRAVGDRRGEATTLTNIGGVYSASGENARALDYYAQALPLQRAVGDRRGEATTLNNLGGVYADLGENARALDYYAQALPLQRAVGDRSGEATTLSNIGAVYSDLGDNARALDYFEQALPLRRAVGDRRGEAATLTNIGLVYSALGDNARALDYYAQALPLRRAVGDRRGEATTLNNLGLVYSALGDNARALDYFEQALPLRRAVGDRRGEAVTCFNIGMAYQNLGDLDKAIEYVSRCVELDRQVQHPDLENDQRVLEQLKRQRNGAELASQTLSEEIIKALADNTVAVKTSVPDSLDEWHTQLQAFRDEAASKGVSWQVEVAFADALIAMLDDQPAALPDNNPYKPYLQAILSAIDDFKKGTNP